ncbi:hypothetical protein HPB50_000494 [Hyalomma asiaticum]|uniref:Uncharacterized protein n=1 Tax=Hyalomma asiaticum TaxID=266040 RepID=A0ACB7RNH8_HYAAI|nr:hypothetical protein HPB50_000494 [Hyalomma asiaticum]
MAWRSDARPSRSPLAGVVEEPGPMRDRTAETAAATLPKRLFGEGVTGGPRNHDFFLARRGRKRRLNGGTSSTEQRRRTPSAQER